MYFYLGAVRFDREIGGRLSVISLKRSIIKFPFIIMKETGFESWAQVVLTVTDGYGRVSGFIRLVSPQNRGRYSLSVSRAAPSVINRR